MRPTCSDVGWSRPGYRGATNLELYSAVRAALALGLPLLVWGVLPQMEFAYKLFLLILTATFGYYLPTLWVSHRVEKRQ